MSAAKMFVRGMKEPILITLEQGEKVNKMLEDDTIPEESRINVANGKWVGAKKLINYVTFEKMSHVDQYERTFSKKVVEKYRSEIEEHLKGRPMTNKLRMEYWDKKKAVRIEKVMSKVPGLGEIWSPIITNLPLFTYIRELENFVEKLDSRNAWGEQKNQERLEQSIEKVTERMTKHD